GIDLSLTASGLSVQTQSLVSILIGGIAFETPATGPVLPAAAADTVFTLYGDRKEAFQLPARDPQTFQLVFKQSVRGLTVGAPVEFHGIPIGHVVALDAQVDVKTFEFSVPVTVIVDATRFGVKVVELEPGADMATVHLDETLVSARGTFDSATRLVAPDSTLDTELNTTLQELSRAARGLRVLADYLERHPEALVRGKTGEAK